MPAIVADVECDDLGLGEPIGEERLTHILVDGEGRARMFADDLLPAAQPVGEHQDEIVKTVFVESDQETFSERIHIDPCR